MLKLRSNHNRLVALSALLSVASVMMLFELESCAQQRPELKIVDLEGYPILRIDVAGSAFDSIENKVAVIDDREGSFTLTKVHKKFSFKHDPAIQRDNDHYTVKLGDGAVFEVKPDGGILLNGELWGRVIGYAQNDAQRDRFMAALAIIPLVSDAPDPDGVSPLLPREVKNAERDPAIRKESIIWIYKEDEIYLDNQRLEGPWRGAVEEFLKRRNQPNKTVYVVAGVGIDYETVVRVIDAIRASGVDQIGLIVGGRHPWDLFHSQIPWQRDPNEDPSKWKPNPLLLGVELSRDGQIKLITGGMEDFLLGSKSGKSEAKGSLDDSSDLSQTLARIFEERKQQRVYKPGMETRTDVPDEDRVQKTVVIKGCLRCRYGDVIKIIDVVKGAGANPIVLRVDDLGY